MRIVVFLGLLLLVQGIQQQKCNQATCKVVASDCINDDKCYAQLKGCLATLQKELRNTRSNQDEYNKSLDRFQECMNNSVQSGKFLACAKNTCPSSFVYFISQLFNSQQSKSLITLDGLL